MVYDSSTRCCYLGELSSFSLVLPAIPTNEQHTSTAGIDFDLCGSSSSSGYLDLVACTPTTTTSVRKVHYFMAEVVHIFKSRRYSDYDRDVHLFIRPVDRDKAEAELTLNIKKGYPQRSLP